jgi:hypothetical protein
MSHNDRCSAGITYLFPYSMPRQDMDRYMDLIIFILVAVKSFEIPYSLFLRSGEVFVFMEEN